MEAINGNGRCILSNICLHGVLVKLREAIQDTSSILYSDCSQAHK